MSTSNASGLRARPRQRGHAYAHAAWNTRVTTSESVHADPQGSSEFCQWPVAALLLRLVIVRVLLVFAIASAVGGCEGNPTASDLCVAAELCEVEPPSAETIDVLCDLTPASSCDSDFNATTARAALEYLSTRPASHLRIWVMGTSAPLRPSLEVEVPESRRQSATSRERERERWVDDQTRAVVTLTTGGTAPARQSPIAETLTRIAAYPANGVRTVIVVTDMRERSSVGNLECGRLISSRRFEERLDQHGLLTPGSFSGITVHFAFAVSRPLADRRCPSSIAREQAIAELWSSALARAGAARVEVSQAAPVLESHTNTEPTNDHR